MAYVQKNNPFNVTPCGRRRTFMHDNAPMTITSPNTYMEDQSPLEKRLRKTTKGKSRNFRTVKEGAGMTSAGVRKYRKNNPGSKLKTAVTGKVKRGIKAAKRRKSFCARSKGWKSKRGLAARRRWNC